MNTTSDSRPPDDPLFRPDELEVMRRRLHSLTPRQRQVMLLVGEGIRPAEIARRLDVSKQTVSFHLTRGMRKLGLRSPGEFLVYAVLLRRSPEESEPHSPHEPG